ncbi:MAG: hypothetical protein AMQ22_02247 [Candidatus Methanofastidiosum methylothiophilum]|uniref:Uncharacterized protein n=1 Tax=Candidatus Methanofastidiosum methylothiophilum TaxID=1705564 RepID=A0A150IJ58_9EURY|nr:MAG: hypothetical protein AMQ22_02247 [Candidatus Methanofastidiosum methylthiophilus]
MRCEKCGGRMKRLYSPDEGIFYYECQNPLPDGSICWNIYDTDYGLPESNLRDVEQ